MAVSVRKTASIDTIKFIGRQHSHLTDIMDQINSCYVFQVKYFYVLQLLRFVLLRFPSKQSQYHLDVQLVYNEFMAQCWKQHICHSSFMITYTNPLPN